MRYSVDLWGGIIANICKMCQSVLTKTLIPNPCTAQAALRSPKYLVREYHPVPVPEPLASDLRSAIDREHWIGSAALYISAGRSTALDGSGSRTHHRVIARKDTANYPEYFFQTKIEDGAVMLGAQTLSEAHAEAFHELVAASIDAGLVLDQLV